MSEEEKKITGEIDINKTIESNIDYWRNKCFEQQNEIEELKAITRTYEAYECREDNKIVIAPKEYFINGFFKDFLNDYIRKDKIKEKIDLIDKEYAEFIENNKNDLYLVNINAQRHNAMQTILEELLGESNEQIYKYIKI